MLDYKFLKKRGALNEAARVEEEAAQELLGTNDLANVTVPPSVVELIPHSVARENLIFPLHFDGEKLTLAAANPDDIALADKLRFILAKDVKLVPASREAIKAAIDRHYGTAVTETVESFLQEFTDSQIDFTESELRSMAPTTPPRRGKGTRLLHGAVESRKGVEALEDEVIRDIVEDSEYDLVDEYGGGGMLYYTVPEGLRVLMCRRDGTMEVIVGPKRVWRWGKTFQIMKHHVAHPDKFLVIRYRDGRQEHLPGPAEAWFDPRVHQQISAEDALQLAAKEAVVVYSKGEENGRISRRIVYGPAVFVPRPGEWLHTFSWHASKGGSRGAQKVAHALVFQKLWLMPDQMYHDVTEVRTADDAVLTIRLMIFFELVDIERMLDATHDPIGDFVNAATSDVVAFTGRYDFESFKRNTSQLNELETYRQLTGRASQCGYRINKVVFRGYGSADALQQMHDQAIQARTRLQLDRATEQQAQDLENYKLECQLGRAAKRREEQVSEVEYDLALARTKQEAELHNREAQQAFAREARRLESDLQLSIRRNQDQQQEEHLNVLRNMGVDLTAFLTQARADQVIELRGAAGTHVHLDPRKERPAPDGAKSG